MNKKRFGFSLLSTTLMGLALVVSCTVTDGDGSDGNGSGDCTAGRSIPCTCANGDHGMQVCNSSGTGYGLCNCEGGGEAGATASGGADGQGGATGYAGEGYGAEGGWTATAGAGGADVNPAVGGAGGVEAVGGAGGAPGLCEEQTDPCESCYHTQCCAELTACLEVQQCLDEFIGLRQCSNDMVDAGGGNASPAEIDSCADDNGGWHGNHAIETVNLIDCMNGGIGWENEAVWGEDAKCAQECYGAQ